MPSIRIGFSTDFNLVGEQVGIGTTNPTALLEVAGQILVDKVSGSGGITTLTRYDGFLDAKQALKNRVVISETTKGNLNSLSGEIKIDGEITVGSATTITGGRLDSLSVTDKFDLPSGGTNERLNTAEKGSTRFNQDFGTLEFFDGVNWKTVNSYSRGGAAGRGVWAAGDTPTRVSTIDYVNFSTRGNAVNFGDVTNARSDAPEGVVSSGIRGIFSHGSSPPTNYNVIDYITIASEGNAIDFGDSTRTDAGGACSSSTRGLFAGGTNTIDYIEIHTLGNSINFGDLTVARATGPSGLASPTRGVFGGGTDPAVSSRMDFVTIASLGNAITFGELSQKRRAIASCSNTTRGVFMGGSIPGYINTIDYITISSTGNATTFGSLATTTGFGGGCGSQTLGLIGGGYDGSAVANHIQFISINTTGDSTDFGDLSQARNAPSGCSDSHGGLGGF